MPVNQIIFKGADCPVCGEYHDNYCRTLGDLFLCRSGATDPSDRPNFKFIKFTSCLTWGLYKPASKDSPLPSNSKNNIYICAKDYRTASSAQNVDFVKKLINYESLQTFYNSLPAPDRQHPDLAHRILPPQTLNRLRILTCDLKLSEELKSNLPAIAPPGIYIPAFNLEQKPIGFQYIPQEKFTKKGVELPKYLWLSKKGSTKIDNEYPLNFVNKFTKKILLCEGLLKSHIIADRFGLTTIGAASGNFLQSWKQLKEIISFVKPTHIYFAADAGSQTNLCVWHKIKKLATHLPALRVLDYGQLTDPNTPDPDEIENATIEKILGYL